MSERTWVEDTDFSRERADCARQRLARIKAVSGCVQCGEDDPRCLDFHHLDPGTKFKSVSQMVSHSWKKVLAEITKCEIICANCHRKLHR